MAKAVEPPQWERYCEGRFLQQLSIRGAAQRAGIDPSTCWRLETKTDYKSSGRAIFNKWKRQHPDAIHNPTVLSSNAKLALDDFAYFRLRYFGRKSTPWQVHAANTLRETLDDAKVSTERRFLVVNCPPGSGKTTLFTHDIPIWLLCRDRATRVLLGSASEQIAKGYSGRVMTTLERTSPQPLEAHQARRGAQTAEACLMDDFGGFKPENGRNWREAAFKITQEGDQMGSTQEASVSAFGRDSNYMGQRPDISIWDDLVTEETSSTAEAREKTLRKWENTAEMRVEPGGVLVLQGQRLFADDLYRTCIDAPTDEEDEAGEVSRKYVHIVFKAHYEEHCKGDHGKGAQPYDPANPENSGCLLDPIGLSWKFLRQIMRKDEERGTSVYRITMQQEDGDPANTLVNPLWIDGGVDKVSGERFFGCWDEDRPCGVVPRLQGETISVISVDSSPSKWWAIGWWVYDYETQRRYLIDFKRAKLQVNDVLAYDKATFEWSGLFDEWVERSKRQGFPVSHLIFETVAAEKYFTRANDWRDWSGPRGVTLIEHDTHRNKTDPRYGVQGSLPPVYRAGLVRLPGDVASGARVKVMPLVREITHWPDTSTEDGVMQQWFFEFRLPTLQATKQGPIRRQLPGYVKRHTVYRGRVA